MPINVDVFSNKRYSPAVKKQMAWTAAAMYGGATFAGFVESLTPGGPSVSLLPAFVSLGVAPLLVVYGPRLPVAALAALGPLGVALLGVALATTPGAGDGALIYVWPVLWVAYFFGWLGTLLIVVWVAIVHAAALLALPADSAYLDRGSTSSSRSASSALSSTRSRVAMPSCCSAWPPRRASIR